MFVFKRSKTFSNCGANILKNDNSGGQKIYQSSLKLFSEIRGN